MYMDSGGVRGLRTIHIGRTSPQTPLNTFSPRAKAGIGLYLHFQGGQMCETLEKQRAAGQAQTQDSITRRRHTSVAGLGCRAAIVSRRPCPDVALVPPQTSDRRDNQHSNSGPPRQPQQPDPRRNCQKMSAWITA
jgi:hypothetical protein